MAYFHTTVLDNQIKALPTVGTASGSIATFDTDMTENLVEVVCDIQYQQASGTPSPSNPLPITVYTSLNLSHSGADTSNPNVTNIPFGQTVAKGTLNVITGVLTAEWLAVDLGSLSYTYYTSGTNPIFYASLSGSKIYATSDTPDCACSCYKVVSANNRTNLASNLNNYECSFITNGTNFTIRNDDYTDPTAFATAMVGQTVVYELASPLTLQLSTTQITALLNENNIWCDTNGDTSVKYILSVGKVIS